MIINLKEILEGTLRNCKDINGNSTSCINKSDRKNASNNNFKKFDSRKKIKNFYDIQKEKMGKRFERNDNYGKNYGITKDHDALPGRKLFNNKKIKSGIKI